MWLGDGQGCMYVCLDKGRGKYIMCVLLIQIEELESELDEQSILQASVS